jgi:protein-disulfide isomerase
MQRILSIALALVGLAVSVVLAIDYVGPAPAYCAEGGCATVRASAWSHPLGIPMPILGAGFFAAVLALVAIGPRAARPARVAAIGGGAAALGLILIQGAVIGAWCRLCLVVDGSAIALAAIALASARPPQAVRRRGRGVIAAFGAAAIAAPIAIAQLASPPAGGTPVRPVEGLPEVVAREQVPGVVTIVEFVDFEGPFCRALHARIAEVLADCDRPVRVVRKMVPLRGHAHALPAAIAWCGADALGKGDEMADALMAADPSELTPEGCERLAASLGMDVAAYRAACAAPATRERIARDMAEAREAGVRFLPTVYIGATAFAGAGATEAELAAAIEST